MLRAAPVVLGAPAARVSWRMGQSPPQPRCQGGTGPSWVPVCLEVTRWGGHLDAPTSCLALASPLAPSPRLHLLLGRTPTSEALGQGRGAEAVRLVGPGGAAHSVHGAGFPGGPEKPASAPPPALLASARWGRGERGCLLDPCPGPQGLPGRAASVHSARTEATAALGRGGYQGCPPRSGQGQGVQMCTLAPAEEEL